MKGARRVVLDTNIVVSALLLPGGAAGAVRAAWQAGRIVPLASAATARELVRVLAYPKFRDGSSDPCPIVTLDAFVARL
ncbi:MAG: hypothetical protein RJA99_199 [Pseudomonadota bacterium]|jgi:predicted nucleic acid-binding protein